MNAFEQVEQYLDARQRELGGHERALEGALLGEVYELEVARAAGLVSAALCEAGDAARDHFFDGAEALHPDLRGVLRQIQRDGIDGALRRVIDAVSASSSPRP